MSEQRAVTPGEQEGINQHVALAFKALSRLSRELALAGQPAVAMVVDRYALEIRNLARPAAQVKTT